MLLYNKIMVSLSSRYIMTIDNAAHRNTYGCIMVIVLHEVPAPDNEGAGERMPSYRGGRL